MNQIRSSRAPIIHRKEIEFVMGWVMISSLAAMVNFRFGLAAFYHRSSLGAQASRLLVAREALSEEMQARRLRSQI
jgi:hypothetical protein